jgi:hypothetical protein
MISTPTEIQIQQDTDRVEAVNLPCRIVTRTTESEGSSVLRVCECTWNYLLAEVERLHGTCIAVTARTGASCLWRGRYVPPLLAPCQLPPGWSRRPRR